MEHWVLLENTGSRASLIETYDGKEVMVPNEDLITNRVINYTHSNKKARITINISVCIEPNSFNIRISYVFYM